MTIFNFVNSTFNANSDANTLTHDKIIKSQFNKNNVATVKTNKILTKILLVGSVKQVQWCQYVPIQVKLKFFEQMTAYDESTGLPAI